ncbi:unnamed protein product [Caenorhabditis brenneri]
MSSLLEMTDVPMTNILEKCGFKSVLTLRKVCHSLRNFIDDSCFKTDLDSIEITIGPNGFFVICRTNPLWTNRTSLADGWNSKDLKTILKMTQNTKLSRICVNTNRDNAEGLNVLEEILKNQTRPLQAEQFEMGGSEILKVLPYIDSKILKEIYIRPARRAGADDQVLDGIEEVIELEQFKNAMELTIDYCFLVRADLRKFFHFQRVSMKLHETSLEELVALKEAFVTSTHMVYFTLSGRGLNKNQLAQMFGTPFHDPRPFGTAQWFFKIQNCKEHVLRIEWGLGGLKFRKLEANEVPQDAVVQH